MKLGKYLWLLGTVPGAWLIKMSWHDKHEGPIFQIIGLLIVLASIVIVLELIREETVSEVKALIEDKLQNHQKEDGA